jgi:hypothetical protein
MAGRDLSAEIFGPANGGGQGRDLSDEIFGAAQPVKEAGFSLGDIAKSFGIGAAGSTKALTDVAGAENLLSSKLGQGVEGLQQSLTPERRAEMERQAARMKVAEESGSLLQEIKAGALNVAEAPLQSAAQAIGSFVPYLPALFAAPVAAAMRLSVGSQAAIRAVAQQAPKVIGTAQGAGAIKGSIYDGVLQAEMEAGVDPEIAKQKADTAQSYFGGNFDQIALGAGLGLAAGSTGVEKFFTPAGRAGVAPGIARRVAGATLAESLPEAAQGGQERLAQNIALQREGYDVDTFKGVAGAATQEGLTGALGAAPIAALVKPEVKPPEALTQVQDERDQFAKEFGEGTPVDAPAPVAAVDLPGGFTVTQRELSREEVPESFGIFAEGSDKPLTTVATQADIDAKITSLTEIRAEEQARLLKESDAITKNILAEQRKIDVMEATGQTDTDEYVQAKALLAQKELTAAEQIQDLNDKIASYSAPLSFAPIGLKTNIQSDFVATRGDEIVGTYPTFEEAEATLRAAEPEVFKQADLEAQTLQAQAESQKLDELLRPLIVKFNLGDVGLNIVDRIANNAGGSYSGLNKLIEISMTGDKPLLTMRHEALHALKDLDFFTPQQWKALTERANKDWLVQLKKTPYEEGVSRYDAYLDMFTKEGQAKGLQGPELEQYANEALIEEAIADAFGAYESGVKPPPGLIAALFKKLKDFFKNFGQALRGAGFESSEDIFERVERGELKSRKPKAKKAEEKLSLPIMRGEEVPKFEGPPKEGKTEPTKIKPTVDSIGKYFDDQVREEFGSSLDFTDKASFDRAVKLATEEVAFQLKSEKSGLNWYEDDVKDAFKQTKKLIPELSKIDNRLLFSVMAGIMSPQTTARDNWFIAAKAFQHYVGAGVIPGINPETGGLWQGGTTSVNKKAQLDFLNKMVKDMGQKKALEWLFTDHTVKEINSFRSKYGNIKSGIDGKLTDMRPGLYAFGPKVGPFVSNLNGIHDVTVDKWMTRTFNRYFGKMLGPDGKIVDAPTEPQRRAIKALINEVAKNAGIKPYQAQSLLWFYEQQLFTKIGVLSPSYGFSDGAKRFVEAGGRGGEKGVSDAAAPATGKLSLRKGIVAEVAPNPDQATAEKWREMTPKERINSTKAVADKTMSAVFSELGFTGYSYTFSSGKYEGEVNPNIIVEAPENATTQELDELGRVLGYVLDQKAMVVFDEGNKTSGDQAGFVRVEIPEGMTEEELSGLRDHIAREVPQADGDTLRDDALLYGNFSAYNDKVDTLDDKQYHQAILDAIESFDYAGTIRVFEPERFHSSFIWPDTRADYLKETRYGKSGAGQGEAGAGVRGQGSSRLQAISENAIALRDRWIDARGAARLGGGERGSAIDYGKPTAEYGTATEDSVSAVGVHFSQEPRATLSSEFHGAGLRGLERERLNNKDNADIRSRIYFYVDNGKGIRPEAGVGGAPHVIQLNNLYNTKTDPLQILKNTKGDSQADRASQWERGVREAGFDGYLVKDLSSSQDYAVLIGKHAVKTKLSLRTAPTTPEFKRFFGDSKVVNKDGNPKVMYHGTSKDVTDFTRKEMRGAPIFLTDDPAFADRFALDSVDVATARVEQVLSDEQIAGGRKLAIAAIRKDYRARPEGKVMIDSINTNDYSKATPEAKEYLRKAYAEMMPSGPNVMPVYVSAQNPFDYDKPANVKKVVAALKENVGDYPIQSTDRRMVRIKDVGAVLQSGNWNFIESEDVQQAIKDAGFDSFYVREHGIKNLAVYKSAQVKSAIGNDGTYGVGESDVRYSLKNVSFPSVKAVKEAVETTGIPKTDAFKQFIAGNQWVDKDGGQKVFYHATARDFFEFTPAGKTSVIYLSDTPEEAEVFGKIAEDRLRQQVYRALTKDEKIDFFQRLVDAKVEKGSMAENEGANFIRQAKRKIPDFGKFGDLEKEVRAGLIDLSPTRMSIMPLYARAETPFDFRNPEHIAQVASVVRRPDPKLSEKAIKEARELRMPSEYPDNWYRGLPGLLKQGFLTSIEQEPVQTAIRKLGFDGYVGRQNRNSPVVYAVYKPEQVKSVTGNIDGYGREIKDIRFSLPTFPTAINDQVNATTFTRKRKGFAQRMIEAISPQSAASFRARFLNRYNQLSVYDKKLAEQMGGAVLLADQSAESAALFSDVGAGIAASAMGMGDRNGGIPVLRNGVTTIDTSVKGLVASLAPLAAYNDPKIYQLYQYWAMVKRGKRLDKEGKPTGITTTDVAYAAAIEAKFPKDLFNNVQKDLIAFNNGLVKYMVDTGVLSKERGAEYTKYADYVPFYRQMDGENTIGPNLFQSLSGVKPPKKLKGKDVTEAPLADFLETMVRNTQSAIQAGIKNYAGQRAINVASQVNAPGMGVTRLKTPSTAPDVINVLEKGELVSYGTADNLLIEAVKSLNLSDLPFMGILSAPADLLRNLVTKDPGFMMANLLRDSLSAYVTSGVKMTPVVDTVMSFGKSLTRNSPTFEALLNAGIISGYDSGNIEKSGLNLEKDLAKKAGQKDALLLRPFTSLWDALEKGTTASDAATRVVIYERVMAETGNEAEALFRSMEVMNFHRKGSSSLIRVLTAAVPFFNARLQGLDLFYRASTGNMNNKDAAAIQRQFFVRGMTMMALSTAYWFMVSDDEEYKKQEQETKDNNWLIPALGIRIPIPFEVGVLFKTIPERIAAYTFGNDTGQDLRDSLFRNAVSTFAFNPIPQTVKPLVEAAFNVNTFTFRPIVSEGMQDVDPQYQVGPGTSSVAKGIAGVLGLSPMKVDHVIKGYTGTLGMYGVDTLDMVMDQFGDSPRATKRFEQLPVIKRFALDPEARGNVTEYYKLKDSVDSVVRTMNFLEKQGESEEYVEYLKENQGTFAFKDYIRDTEKTMKELRQMKSAVQISKMSGDEKRDAITGINRAENAINAEIQRIKTIISSSQ